MTEEAELIVLFSFLALLFSIPSIELRKKFKISVAVFLLLFGFLFRWLAPSLHLSGLIQLLDETSSGTILAVLLPPLVFQSGMSTDWHMFKKELWQNIPLATSVFLACTGIQALFLKLSLGYDFTWNQSLLISAVLFSADFTANKDVIKTLHLENSFTSIILGETVLNQVTAITLVIILNEDAEALENIPENVVLVLKIIGLGSLLGLGFSYALGKAIRRVVNDSLLETNLIIATMFLLALVADLSIRGSSIMAVVIFGLYMSAYGKTTISPTVEKLLLHIRDTIHSSARSIGYVLGGVIFSREILAPETITWHELYKLPLTFVLCMLIRFFVLLAHFPFLRKFGYGLSFPKLLFVTVGGIKGSISVLLAIMISTSEAYENSFKSLAVFLTVGCTLLSICVNSFLMRFIEIKFKFMNLTDIQENLLLRVINNILQKTYKKLEKLERSKEFPLVNWEKVLNVAGPKELIITVMKRSKIGKRILKENPNDSAEMLISRFCDYCVLNDQALVCEMRRRFYNSLKGIYWKEFESGQCLGQTSLILINSTSVLQHRDSEPLQDWKHVESDVHQKAMLKFYHGFFEKPVLSGFFRSLVYNRIIKSYDAASTFQKAHKRVRKLFEKMEIDQYVMTVILAESEYQERLCNSFVKLNIIDNYPEIISEVQSKMASYSLLISQRKLINKIFDQGVIRNLEYNYLLTAIDANFKALTFMPSPHIPPLKAVLKNRFKKASNAEIKEMARCSEELHLKPGTLLFNQGEKCVGAFLILTGTVHEYSDWIDEEHSIGNIVGVQHLLPGLNRINSTSAVTMTVVTSIRLPMNMLEYECFEEDIYKEAAEEFLILHKDRFNLKNANNDHIMFLVGKCFVRRAYQGSLVSLKRGGLVIKGKIRSDKGCFSLIRPTKKKIESIDDALLLIFPAHFARVLRHTRDFEDSLAEFYIKNSVKKQIYKPFYAFKQSRDTKYVKDISESNTREKAKSSIDSFDKLLDF
jgi:NhaP-type Na+/H+ or K+/H+ antiporter